MSKKNVQDGLVCPSCNSSHAHNGDCGYKGETGETGEDQLKLPRSWGFAEKNTHDDRGSGYACRGGFRMSNRIAIDKIIDDIVDENLGGDEADVDLGGDEADAMPDGCVCPSCGSQLRLELVQSEEQDLTDELADVSETVVEPTGESLTLMPEPDNNPVT